MGMGVVILLIVLLFGGMFFFIIYFKISERREVNIQQFNGKFSPMSGKCFLYKHEKTGIIMRSNNPDKCTLFQTEEEANKFIEEYKIQQMK